MGFIHYDLEFKRHIDVEKEFNNTIEGIVYYLRRKGNVGIRFKYYTEINYFKRIFQSICQNRRSLKLHIELVM